MRKVTIPQRKTTWIIGPDGKLKRKRNKIYNLEVSVRLPDSVIKQ
jgi:hypothetical protein